MMNLENDLESPGYEYLRSYENMISLHSKLLVLNYEKEFCLSYRCPPIHRFYFSLPPNNNNNSSEQRFVFTCLCAWLIKDKCHMNLDIEPEEYQDPDKTLNVVMDALRLITEDEADIRSNNGRNNSKYPIQNRLKRGYGPEVIWTLNILADRALELMFDDHNDDDDDDDDDNRDGNTMKIKLTYKQSPTHRRPSKEATVLNSITVGQPFVGGGLTTRPLGNYIIDDKSLLISGDADRDQDDDDRDETVIVTSCNAADPFKMDGHNKQASSKTSCLDVDANEWYKRVESSRHLLESVRYLDGDDGDEDNQQRQQVKLEDWSEEISHLNETEKCVEIFLDKSKPTLENTVRLIDRQLQLIEQREKFLQTQLRDKLDDFLKIWRKYSTELDGNKELLAQYNEKKDTYKSLDNRLQDVKAQIEAHRRESQDESKLNELKVKIDKLKAENKNYDTRIGLLLSVYLKLDTNT